MFQNGNHLKPFPVKVQKNQCPNENIYRCTISCKCHPEFKTILFKCNWLKYNSSLTSFSDLTMLNYSLPMDYG